MGAFCMSTAEHREPYESRGSRTVLGARGGEIPLRDSPDRLFSFISQNWRAQPLVSYRVIVELISATTTKTGLTGRCELDTGRYPSGVVVSDAERAAINIKPAEFHGEWNYTISPNTYPPNCAFIS
jgi:Rhodopirellula transposase DDE domain